MTPPIRMVSVPVEDLLFYKLKDLILEQSEGEWDDATIVRDAHHFANHLRPMLTAAPVREEGGGWSAVRSVFVTYAGRFSQAARYEEASAIADMAAHDLAALATRGEAPAKAGELVQDEDFHGSFSMPYSKPQAREEAGCAELEVGRAVYERIEKLIDAKTGTRDGEELDYLSHLVASVEEVGGYDGPQAREEAQPVVYVAHKVKRGDTVWVRATVVDPCTSCCAVSMRTVHGESHPLIRAEDVFATPPAPEVEKLRVAVEALNAIKAVRVCKESANIWTGADACRKIADQALAALQQEGR